MARKSPQEILGTTLVDIPNFQNNLSLPERQFINSLSPAPTTVEDLILAVYGWIQEDPTKRTPALSGKLFISGFGASNVATLLIRRLIGIGVPIFDFVGEHYKEQLEIFRECPTLFGLELPALKSKRSSQETVALRSLSHGGVKTLGNFCMLQEESLVGIKGVGEATLQTVTETINRYYPELNLHYGMTREEFRTAEGRIKEIVVGSTAASAVRTAITSDTRAR